MFRSLISCALRLSVILLIELVLTSQIEVAFALRVVSASNLEVVLLIELLLTFKIEHFCLQARIDATHVAANLQRQRVDSKYIAANYLENNFDLIDILILGYEDGDIALTYGAIARECIRHQSVAKYVLESPHVKKFFNYLQIPNFNVASDAQATFKVSGTD
ncbi:hypothetical protein Patl1_01877 [Pistacia atlantica]|uniref:Uncharacterized protein n=1 Tax=Pistacia atlantica TaxID=434234 RepID=A0ACC1CB09_9ROSI|nr:hypothetical protein Patl1_01877 [Pistacia atlantica]